MGLESFGPALLMALGGLAAWFIKSKTEELRTIEKKLRIERRKVYEDILDPIIQLFSGFDDENVSLVKKKITSQEYRKTTFNLNLVGSDGVVRAYNNLMQNIWDQYRFGAQKI